jgi:putative endonuclease
MAAMGAFLYMLRCSDGSYYVGCATGEDLSKRVDDHNAGKYPGYTSSRRPVELAWSQYFERVTDAIAAELRKKEGAQASPCKPSGSILIA